MWRIENWIIIDIVYQQVLHDGLWLIKLSHTRYGLLEQNYDDDENMDFLQKMSTEKKIAFGTVNAQCALLNIITLELYKSNNIN